MKSTFPFPRCFVCSCDAIDDDDAIDDAMPSMMSAIDDAIVDATDDDECDR